MFVFNYEHMMKLDPFCSVGKLKVLYVFRDECTKIYLQCDTIIKII
jgi:hypothetical protein